MVDAGVRCSVCQGPGLMTVITFWKPDPTDLRPCSSAMALTEHRQARRRGWRLPTGQAEAAQAMSDYAYAALQDPREIWLCGWRSATVLTPSISAVDLRRF
jgi:hypothetical protein